MTLLERIQNAELPCQYCKGLIWLKSGVPFCKTKDKFILRDYPPLRCALREEDNESKTLKGVGHRVTSYTCPNCGAQVHTQAETVRCWRCRKIIPTCGSCKHKEKGKLSDECFTCEKFSHWEGKNDDSNMQNV